MSSAKWDEVMLVPYLFKVQEVPIVLVLMFDCTHFLGKKAGNQT
jgi:hypothetical protein